MIDTLSKRIASIEEALDPIKETSLPQQIKSIQEKRTSIEDSLNIATKAFQENQTMLTNWKKGLQELEGTQSIVGTLNWLEDQLHLITIEKPVELKDLIKERTEK